MCKKLMILYKISLHPNDTIRELKVKQNIWPSHINISIILYFNYLLFIIMKVMVGHVVVQTLYLNISA